MEMRVLTLKIQVWNDVFRVISITIIIFYRLPNYYVKTERMKESKN